MKTNKNTNKQKKQIEQADQESKRSDTILKFKKKKKNKKEGTIKNEMVEGRISSPKIVQKKKKIQKEQKQMLDINDRKKMKKQKRKNKASDETSCSPPVTCEKTELKKKAKHKLVDANIIDNDNVILPKKFKLAENTKNTVTKHKEGSNKNTVREHDEASTSGYSKIYRERGHKHSYTESSTSQFEKDTEVPRLKVSSGFSWDEKFTLPADKQEESSSDESEEEQEEKVDKTRAEIRLEKKAEEQKIFEIEKKRLAGVDEPQTADDFDRLVLQSPNSSLVWTRYMAYHLECTEIDKARAVAERALKTISFRDEQEKLNIWVAYLNFQNMYGTSDQLEELFERAKENCDAMKIHQRMISIYVRSEKFEEAEQLHNIIVKRFSTDKQVWLNFVVFSFLNNRLESGRKLLQRSFKCLEKKEHITMICKVAQMEIKHGDGERGRTMYENLIGNYPKRLDLWSVYIDMVRILGDVEGCRKIFERVLALKMNAKKMKFIFKKYLDFENQYGSPERVEEIREKALKYVESKGFYDDL